MAYEIQAKGKWGDFDAGYISSDPDATTFGSQEEAEREIENLRRENPAYTGSYRIVEMEFDYDAIDSEVFDQNWRYWGDPIEFD